MSWAGAKVHDCIERTLTNLRRGISVLDVDQIIDITLNQMREEFRSSTNDYSIKTLVSYLGFKWRDKEPSGAASIEWYHRWVETGDTAIRQRILDYNEDDCIAMRVLLDAVQRLPLAKN